jgi:hypothetical protein
MEQNGAGSPSLLAIGLASLAEVLRRSGRDAEAGVLDDRANSIRSVGNSSIPSA